MANVVKLKRGSGSDPSASDMVVGEPVIRTDTAELFFKKDDGSVAKVSGGGGGPDFKYLELRNAANNGAASYPGNDFTLVSAGTTTAVSPAAANTLLLSVSGVIQKPNSGTSTSGITGFIVDGSRLKWATNIPAAPDFILYQESGGIGEPSDETVGEDKLKVSNSPVNGYFLSAQSGNTGGLTWAAPVATSCTGNSATATALATARAINGVNFDGTAAITVTAAAGTLSGTTLNSSVVTSSLTSLGDLAGLTVDGDATFTGANYNVLWDKSANALEFADNAKATFGTGNDLQIYHDGSNSYITNTTGLLLLQNSGTTTVKGSTVQFENAAGTEVLLKAIQDGAVELYHDNSKKFFTITNGVQANNRIIVGENNAQRGLLSGDANSVSVGSISDIPLNFNRNSATKARIDGNDFQIPNDTGKIELGASQDLQIYHDGTASYIAADDLRITNNAVSETLAKFIANGAVELYHNDSKKFETYANGCTVTGNLNAGNVDLGDNAKARFGASNDLQIYHDGSHSYIQDSGTGNLRIRGDDIEITDNASNNNMARFLEGGAVELYHNNSKKFETTSGGVDVTGDVVIDGAAGGTLTLGGSSAHTSKIVIADNAGNGNGNLLFEGGDGTDFFTVNSAGSIIPSGTTRDLGSSSNRWRNIYTNDLNLSNEGGANDVDGTWGSYTIQEGAEDLFLVNKRSGKKYKFNLTEIS